MNELYGFLVDDVFIGFLQQVPELLEEINAFEGDLQILNNRLLFTLPALFELTCNYVEKQHQQTPSRYRSDYLQFRKQLYNNPTNTVLQDKGGVVEIEKSDFDHDKSLYKLVFLER